MNAPLSIVRRVRFAAGVACVVAAAQLVRAQEAPQPAASDPKQAAIKQELEYIRLLQNSLRMPDFADLVIQDLKKNYPEAAVQVLVAEIEGMLSQGKFAEVKAIVDKRSDADSVETWGLKLALGDGYFAYGKYNEAKAIYDAFFKRFEKPPAELASFYRDSAYKYVQMMLLLKQDRSALEGYRRMLKQALDPNVERQVRAEMAELMVRVAGEDSIKAAEKAALLKEAEQVVDKLFWQQDIWFGKAVVLKAHVKLMGGNVEDAQKMVETYMPQLKQIHDALVKEEKELNVSGLVRLSPMAECRYLLAVMLYDEARKIMKEPGFDQEKVKTLLFGAKGADGKRSGTGAFNHFINVFVQYPESQWAADAGARTEEIKELVKKTFGTTITVPITAKQRETMFAKQFGEARMLYNQGQYDKAVDALLTVVNRVPPSPEMIAVLGDLARSYIELEDEWGPDVVTGHLAERFCQNPELQETAGNELMRLAEFYAERKLEQKRKQVYDSYLRNYLEHSLRAPTLMRFGEQSFQQKDLDTALGYYGKLVSTCTNSPFFFDALNRTAQIYEERDDHTNAVSVLSTLIQETESRGKPGPLLVSAKFRLALTQKNMAVAALRANTTNDTAPYMRDLIRSAAIFGQLAKTLSDPAGPYARAEDKERNLSVLEAALFNKAYCLQLVTAPVDKVPELQRLAVEGYVDLVTRFPKSKYAPSALMQAGSIRSLSKDSAGANQLFEKLRKDYPESAEAKNVLFEMGRRFLDMGYRSEAVETFKKMFVEQGSYTDSQILLAGQELLKAKEYDLSIQAFDRVVSSAKDQALRITAQLGKAEAQIAQEKFAAAVPDLKKLAEALKGSTRLVDVNLLLSRAASEQGMREQDADKRLDYFNSSVTAMKTVKTYRTNTLERAQTDVEVGRLLTRKARAEEKFGKPEGVRKYKGQAVAAYQALFMQVDPANTELAPVLEVAYHECLPMMAEIKLWQDLLDDCNAYLESFPAGKWASEIRTLKNQAEIEVSTSGGPKKPAPADK